MWDRYSSTAARAFKRFRTASHALTARFGEVALGLAAAVVGEPSVPLGAYPEGGEPHHRCYDDHGQRPTSRARLDSGATTWSPRSMIPRARARIALPAEAPQVVGQRRGRGVPPAGSFPRHFRQIVSRSRGHPRPQAAQRHRVGFPDLLQRLLDARPP